MSFAVDVLDLSDKTPDNKLTKIVRTFNGTEREWCLRNQSGVFSKRFRISRAEKLEDEINSFSHSLLCEQHMSVQRFKQDSTQKYWTFIIDLDKKKDAKEFNKEQEIKKVIKLLSTFEVFYLIDSRFHIWIPDWETSLIPEWNTLYGDDENFVLPLKYYFEFVTNLSRKCYVDEMLWKAKRHPIRMPYSPHLDSGTTQTFLGRNWTGTDEEIMEIMLNLWDGCYFDYKDLQTQHFKPNYTTYEYAIRFKVFISYAIKYGKELVKVLKKEEPLFEQTKSKTGEIRPCFKSAIKSGYMPHLQRLALLKEALCCGLSREEMIDLFRTQTDFKESTTMYQVDYFLKHLKNGGIDSGPWRCLTLSQRGWCLGEICPIFQRKK